MKGKVHKRWARHTLHSPVCDPTGWYAPEATTMTWNRVTCKKCLAKRRKHGK